MAVSENDLIVGPLVPANGVSVISLDFYFEDEAWLEVYKNDSETPLVLSVDYTTTGEGTATGTVVLTTPANGTDAYSVYLVVPLERTSDMQLRGEFRSEPFNLEMDRMWQALQGRRTASDRTMRFASAGQTLTPIYIPSAAAGAGRNLRISDDGLGLEISTYTEAELAAAQVNAEASAVAAAASAATAEAARDATLAAYDNFDDRYLGEFAVPPTTDNDGDPLASGMLYFDTVDEAMKVYSETSAAWIDAYASGETFVAKTGSTMTGALAMSHATAATINFQDSTPVTKAQLTYSISTGRITLQTTGTGGNAFQVGEAAGGIGGYVYENGVVAARFDAAGTSMPNAKTVVTKEKGDAAYAKIADVQTWTTATPVAAAGQGAIDFTGIPSGVKKIQVIFAQLSTTGSDNVLVQFGVSGVPVTSGYVSGAQNGGALTSSSAGMIARRGSAADALSGAMNLELFDGTTWTSSHSLLTVESNGTSQAGGGIIIVGSEIDMIRVTRSGTDTFDTGSVTIKYLS